MNHSIAVENLLAFAEGRLDGDLEPAVAAHAESCGACREWLETFQLLADGLSLAGEGGHLDSGLLARHAAQPHALSDFEAAYVEGHLATCRVCAEDLALVRAALGATGASAPMRSAGAGSSAVRLRRSRQVLVAAALSVAIVLGFVVGKGLFGGGSESRRGPDGPSVVEAAATEVQEDGHLSGVELDGVRVIESRSNLRISDSSIKNGAKVKIRAGGGIVFGDGFKVESGASLAVEGGLSRAKEPI